MQLKKSQLHFIHIPKSAGHFVNKYFFQTNSPGHVPYRENKHNFTILRNPEEFYQSLYYYWKNQTRHFNKLFVLAHEYTLNEFVYILCNLELLKQIVIQRNLQLTPYDEFVMNNFSQYGLYTGYIMYFCNPNNYTVIDSVLNFMRENISILHFSHLHQDLRNFCSKYSIPIKDKYFDQVINKSIKVDQQILSQETLQLVNKKDKQIIQFLKKYPFYN